MARSTGPPSNTILSRCPPELFTGRTETVALKQGFVLQTVGQKAGDIYFPLTFLASFVRPLADGATVEVGIVGCEGLVGLEQLYGAKAQPNEVIAQIADDAVVIAADYARSLFNRDETFRSIVLPFGNAFTMQIGQTAACNRRHTLEARLARWLLMVYDRMGKSTLELTQEFLAQMLGTRTAGVSEAVGSLSYSGLIRHSRRQIEVVDRKGLEEMSCECYRLVRKFYEKDRVM